MGFWRCLFRRNEVWLIKFSFKWRSKYLNYYLSGAVCAVSVVWCLSFCKKNNHAHLETSFWQKSTLIKVSKVNWTFQLSREIFRSSFERKFDQTNFISPKKTPPKAHVFCEKRFEFQYKQDRWVCNCLQ